MKRSILIRIASAVVVTLFLLPVLFEVTSVRAADPTPTATPTGTPTTAPTPTPVAPIPPNPQTGDLDWSLTPVGPIGIIIISLISGALGGLISDLVALHGGTEGPHRPDKGEIASNPLAKYRHMYDWGTLGRMFAGAIIAVVFLAFFPPQNILALIATGVAAGLSTMAIAVALQNRITSALALIALDQSNEAREKASSKIKGAKEALEKSDLSSDVAYDVARLTRSHANDDLLKDSLSRFSVQHASRTRAMESALRQLNEADAILTVGLKTNARDEG